MTPQRLANEALALGSIGNLLRQQRVEVCFVGGGLSRFAGHYARNGTDIACQQLTGALADLGSERSRRPPSGRLRDGTRQCLRRRATATGGRTALAREQELTAFLGGMQVVCQQPVQLLATR